MITVDATQRMPNYILPDLNHFQVSEDPPGVHQITIPLRLAFRADWNLVPILTLDEAEKATTIAGRTYRTRLLFYENGSDEPPTSTFWGTLQINNTGYAATINYSTQGTPPDIASLRLQIAPDEDAGLPNGWIEPLPDLIDPDYPGILTWRPAKLIDILAEAENPETMAPATALVFELRSYPEPANKTWRTHTNQSYLLAYDPENPIAYLKDLDQIIIAEFTAAVIQEDRDGAILTLYCTEIVTDIPTMVELSDTPGRWPTLDQETRFGPSEANWTEGQSLLEIPPIDPLAPL